MSTDTSIALLQRLFTIINSSVGPRGVFAGIADSAIALLEADGSAIFGYDDVHDTFSLQTARNLSLEAQIQATQALTRRARANPIWLSHLQIVENWADQIRQEEEHPAEDMLTKEAFVSVPLLSSKGALLGVLGVFYCRSADVTGRRQILASLLGSLAAVSLENAYLYESEHHRANFLTEVLRTSEVLQVDQSLDSVLERVVRTISDTLGWQTVAVVLNDFESGVMRPAAWVSHDRSFNAYMERVQRVDLFPPIGDQPWRHPELKVSRSYYGDHLKPEAAWVLKTLRSERRLVQMGTFNPPHAAQHNQWYPEDFLIVPLTYKGTDLGWISVDAPRDGRRPSLARIQELEIFADQVAQAVINARLYNESENERLKLTTVLDGITNGVLAFDTQDRLMFYNRAAERLLGIKLPTTPGVALEVALHGSPLLEFLKDSVRTSSMSGNLFMPEQNRMLLVNMVPLEYTGLVVVMQDMTYFHEMDKLRLELLSSLRHDLKNPLAAIDVIASLIGRSGELNEQQRNYVERLRSASRRAVNMIGDLLDVARLEAGEQLLEEKCSMSAIITDVVEELKFNAEAKQISLLVKTVDGPAVWGDAARLRQVAANLVGNAIKYTPAGGHVTIRTAVAGGELTVFVEDDGIGIPPEHVPHLFERFYRVDPNSDIEGTGLGLTIVKTVVERHGGRVGVQSTDGQGSVFFFTLPLLSPE